MPREYSVETCRELAEAFGEAEVIRPLRPRQYDPGDELTYEVTGVAPAGRATARLAVEAFVGGGFAGQVYRVRLLAIEPDPPDGGIGGLTVGGRYALKILLPPSGRARKFRNAIYAIGFQGAFALQVNPAAARAGALWQKLIRRGAGVRFGTERAVVNVLATLVDQRLGSCGEISEWIDGRNWRFEVDDRLDLRRRWKRGQQVPPDQLGSPEYRAKKVFMADFVALLHEMGAPELARQYEWWTCKSQPNVLKRVDAEGDPAAGLTAVDFRPGLALLPFLPMSPGDVKLIAGGIARGSLVQFDRGDLGRLERFIDAHRDDFADLRDALEELKSAERQYRDSLPDVTHHHLRLLYGRGLWSSILAAAAAGWRIAGTADETASARLGRSRLLALAFAVLGLLPPLGIAAAIVVLAAALAAGRLFPPAPQHAGQLAGSARGIWLLAALLGLAVPLLARLARRLWGREDYRRHLGRIVRSPGYLRRAVRAHVAEALINWHRTGRVGPERALRLTERPWRFFLQWPLAALPAPLHRFLTDARFAWRALKYIFARPVLLYFNAAAREQWLREMVAEGQKTGMLTAAEAERIRSHVGEPFIQKYLKCLAVHVCTLPITQIVSVTVAYWAGANYGETLTQKSGLAVLILLLFQVTPISPGSIVRGLYVVYVVLRERNYRDYKVAVWLGFWKYIGYMAFPIQMAYRYPALARFMAAHWATGAVHVVPVFGEHGALLEHGVFDLFFNRPLTIRRRMREKRRRKGGGPQA